MSEPFPPTASRRRHAQTIWEISSSYKINYVIVIKNFLNLEGHQNPIIGSKFTAILLKGWILPIGGASAVEGLRSTGLPRLVFICKQLSRKNRKKKKRENFQSCEALRLTKYSSLFEHTLSVPMMPILWYFDIIAKHLSSIDRHNIFIMLNIFYYFLIISFCIYFEVYKVHNSGPSNCTKLFQVVFCTTNVFP